MTTRMTDREVALSALAQAQTSRDTEAAHSDADDALCVLLTSLGYADVVEEWYKVGKWYA